MILRTLRQAAILWQADRASYLGAAIAYYALFSVGPLLVISIAVAGMAFGQEAAEGTLVQKLKEFVGPDSAALLQEMVHKSTPASGWAALIGGIVLLFTALGLFQQLRVALQIIWKLKPRSAEGLVEGTVRDYLLAFTTLLVSVVFGVVTVGGCTILTLVLGVWGPRFLVEPSSVLILNFGATLLLLTVVFVFLFRLFSDGRIRFRYLWGGAFVTAVMFANGKFLFALYLASTSVLSAYGAASSLVVFLVWVYYSAQLIFFGAEVVQVSRSSSEGTGKPAQGAAEEGNG
jgi:membrane protein